MSIKTLLRDTRSVSKISTFIIFLALIRCISEPFRLQYYSATILTFTEIKPFLIGSLVSASGLLIITILSYFERYKLIIATCLLIISILIIIKLSYFLI